MDDAAKAGGTPLPGSGAISLAETLDTQSIDDMVARKEAEAMEHRPPPTIAGSDYAVSAFAPPPPEEVLPDFVDSKLAESLRGGRMSIRCMSGANIKRKSDPNKVPRLDPYIKFKLG